MLPAVFVCQLVLSALAASASPAPQARNLGQAPPRDLIASLPPQERAVLEKRDPSGDYAPYKVACPSDITWIRQADSLSSQETDYLNKRQQYLSAINTMATSHGLQTPPRTPKIGIALSGGGYRAMITGLGGVMATMNISSEAAASGVGGWFDGLSYMAGLSGGSWGTGTFMANGGPLPLNLINNVWDLSSNLIFPDDGKVAFYSDLVAEVNSKASEGFPTQITDFWALALGNHLLAPQYRLNTSPNLTFSQLPSVVNGLQNASLPMPIIIAAEREPGEKVIAENATVWEFTPWEFGSWSIGSDNKVQGVFTPIEYLGSQVNNGQANGTCWKGFDQLSFVMGTSSTLFNSLLLQLNASDASGIIVDALKDILQGISADDDDVSTIPNTFANWNASHNPLSNLSHITLFDAGTTNQNVPLEPLLVPERDIDAIIALDNSADTGNSWPNGSSLYTTYSRAKVFAERENIPLRMPAVPSTNGFINGGWNTRPTFFGCNDTNTPIIIYVPNYPWSAFSNTSTFELSYDNATAEAVMLSAMRSFTLNGSVPTWPQCLSCALTDRSFSYASSNRTSECQACFNTWCWDGTDNTADPPDYAPSMGSVPSWLTQKNLVKSGSTTASAAVSPSTSNGAGYSYKEMRGMGGYILASAVMWLGTVLGGTFVWA